MSILEFQDRFVDDEACQEYLFECRWPAGFVCPRCQHHRYWPVRSRFMQCAGCDYQVSLTAGTVLHKSRLPLRVWFWAAYLVSTVTPGISAAQLQRQLGLSRYDTAWKMLHKLRRAMVNAERSKLAEEVEVDEFELGGQESGRKGGRSNQAKAAKCIIAVEVRGKGSGRIRLETITDATADSLCGFVERTVEAGAIVHTDGWSSYKPLAKRGYDHRPRSQRKAKRVGDKAPVMPRAHRAISNLKAWVHGTHRWFSNEHTQVYLDEFTFRYNRRRTPMAAFQTLLGLASVHEPTNRADIVIAKHDSAPERDDST